jgi:hypothetical protein
MTTGSPYPAAEASQGHQPALPRQLELVLTVITATLCVGVIVGKWLLAWRLNVNWDEFYFLNHVYALTRDELTLLFQGAYTHAFTWLTHVPGNEVDQVVAGRLVMVGLLAVTAWILWRVARVWMQGLPAVVPPFVFLTMMPVWEHGGSFRADSLLVPLSLAAVMLLLSPRRTAGSDWAAGALLGMAFAVTVKAVLFAPLVLATVVFRGLSGAPPRSQWSSVARAAMRISAAAAILATVLVGLHSLSVEPEEAQSVANFAASTAGTTVLDTPWFPRLPYFVRYINWQPLPWMLIGVGTGIALVRRRFDVAAMSLSLLPLAFYRNAFPYYYVVMLAPASILVGWALAESSAIVRRHASGATTSFLVAVLWLGTVFNGLRYVDRLIFDEQRQQREVLAGIHQIFSEPVNYIDRCGMVSSFRKVNFFMSTWGLESYEQSETAFMPYMLATHQPEFVLLNSPQLSPSYVGPLGLLAEDRELLAKHYVDYWGPIRVAGAEVSVESSTGARVTGPFAAKYRLVTTEPLMIDGDVRLNGDIIEVPAHGVQIARTAELSVGPVTVRLVIASAKPPPAAEPVGLPLFTNL